MKTVCIFIKSSQLLPIKFLITRFISFDRKLKGLSKNIHFYWQLIISTEKIAL